MTIEQNYGGRSFRHPFRKDRWESVYIPENSHAPRPVVKVSGDVEVALNSLGGSDLARVDFVEKSGGVDRSKSKIYVGAEITSAPELAGKLRSTQR